MNLFGGAYNYLEAITLKIWLLSYGNTHTKMGMVDIQNPEFLACTVYLRLS